VERSQFLPVLLATLAVWAAACADDRSVERPAGSAVVGSAAEVAALAPGEREELRRAGVREVFLEAAGLGWEQGDPHLGAASDPAAGLAGLRLPVALTIHGEWWRLGDVTPGAAAGQALIDPLRQLVRSATATGVAVVGIHFDFTLGEDASLRAYGDAVEAIREELPEDFYLAVSLDRAMLRSPGIEAVAAPADVVVPFLFGPRAAGRPGPRGDEAWSLAGIDEDLARLEELGTPYLVGVGTVGGVWRAGEAEEPLTATRLGALLADRALEARPAPLFAAADAQLYPFVARHAHRLGEWTLAAGEEVEARRLTVHHLRALLERLDAAGSPLHLGQLYDRLPRPREGLALTPAELAAAHGPAAAAPRLELAAEASGRGRMRVRLAHRGGGATEVAAFDHNYVEVRLAGGAFGAVDPGGFARYELLAAGRRAADMAAVRRADVLRLYAPYLERGDEVASGPIRHTGAAALSGRFLMPDGTVVEVTAGEGETGATAVTAGGGS
jgi:hypothetical protein